jgi:hypothetical protein
VSALSKAATIRGTRSGLVLLLVWASSAVYVAGFVDRGWVPHDEGMLAHNAERTLRGELPHRDFDESYTGGLTQLHALTFRAFGVRLLSLRIVLFLFFLLFIPTLYAVARRLLPPWPAGLVALLGVVWSVPNYFASMPSWYVLFFSTAGTYALLRERETDRKSWLFAAGLCGGVSLLSIVVGLYFVAAALLYLAFREQVAAERLEEAGRGLPLFFLFQAASVIGFLFVLMSVVRSHLGPMELLHFVVPSAAVGAVLLRRCWEGRRRGTLGRRCRELTSRVAPFGLGLFLPVALFILPYARSGSLGDLRRGVFVFPFRQVAAAHMRLPPVETIGAALPYLLLLAVGVRGVGRGRLLVLSLAVLLAALLFWSRTNEVYRGVWHSARSIGVVAVLFGCGRLLRRDEEAPPAAREEETFLFLAMTALLTLVQFPFAAPIYLCYVAPIVALGVSAVAREGELAPHGVVAAFYLAFALWRINPGYIWEMGVRPTRYGPLQVLSLPRAGIRVPVDDRKTYELLVRSVEQKSRGPYIYAAPDCPEVYFLSGRRNLTRVVFDYLRDPEPPAILLRRLEAKLVRVVVLNERPDYSSPLSPDLRVALSARFPHSETIGKFVLRWSEGAP